MHFWVTHSETQCTYGLVNLKLDALLGYLIRNSMSFHLSNPKLDDIAVEWIGRTKISMYLEAPGALSLDCNQGHVIEFWAATRSITLLWALRFKALMSKNIDVQGGSRCIEFA